MATTSEFLEAILPNAANDILQNIARTALGHKSYESIDVFFFIAFNHFLPNIKDLEKLNHEKALELIDKCNNYAFTFADNMQHKIDLAKHLANDKDAKTTTSNNIKISKGKKRAPKTLL